ncbi:hypothetical protein ALC53_14227 [Atta colombica]|uniref:Uncharacterized protein n=1 Tax=Atta colombica TaxID=520822 RepID=A0A195ATL1_9HYME|nr:hypothetical protein ALC53_14227 [Atta colombica]
MWERLADLSARVPASPIKSIDLAFTAPIIPIPKTLKPFAIGLWDQTELCDIGQDLRMQSSLSAVIVVIIVEIVIGMACVILVVLFRSVSACPARVPFQSSTQHATDLEARSLYVRYRIITIGTMTTTIGHRHAPQLFLPFRPFSFSSLQTSKPLLLCR